MRYNFDWDNNKNKSNQKKHGVSFEQATAVFRDPRALTLFDDEHSITEERWITLGFSATGGLLVVHHTFKEMGDNTTTIRIFSTRKASKNETKPYTE